MSGTDWQEVTGVIGFFLLVTAVITVTIWQLAATWRAKAVLARENEYRAIADKAVLFQEGAERQLAELVGRLAEIQTRLQSVERILKDVE
ncbi:hypothetical protein MXD61_04615 [Frankia sp. AgPm24]|uniref:hypothetical protein n=1 Tax=Frankia sp. AgPm24 TaxID=631128 RepID=UPI00200FC6CD|nr:hypothetical protein [Frankia sp. AgPm24]MCK9921191.1 hypothetical protein [Frankia sp. AgPm24]